MYVSDFVSVLERGLGWVWMGVGRPLPTRQQRFCDPASLVKMKSYVGDMKYEKAFTCRRICSRVYGFF